MKMKIYKNPNLILILIQYIYIFYLILIPPYDVLYDT